MRNGIAKVPSYLIDMVLLKNKILMIKSGELVISRLTKETIQDFIVLVETQEYEGRLHNQNIKYHLVHVEVEQKTKKADCKEFAI